MLMIPLVIPAIELGDDRDYMTAVYLRHRDFHGAFLFVGVTFCPAGDIEG